MNCRSTKLRIHVARGYVARLRGLHAYPRLAGDCALWLTPCNAIHTFGLAYAIDAVFLDEGLNALKCVENIAPRRAAWCWRARSVVELPGGYCARNPPYGQWLRDALLRME